MTTDRDIRLKYLKQAQASLDRLSEEYYRSLDGCPDLQTAYKLVKAYHAKCARLVDKLSAAGLAEIAEMVS